MNWLLVKDTPPYENCDILFSIPGFDTKLYIATIGFYYKVGFILMKMAGLLLLNNKT